MNITVLGAGRVGNTMAKDLAINDDFEVTVADISKSNLNNLCNLGGIKTVTADLSKYDEIKRVVKSADIVVGALPGFMGFETLKNVIRCKKNIVDISFFNEDPFLLDDLAKKNNVTAIIDCGISPGCGNMILGFLATKLERIDRFLCLVGGLPEVRTLPYEYKAVFSPIDVIEEYTRPARFISGGKSITMPALSEPELIEFPGVGTLEAFNTDGLRTLNKTMPIANMKEKTLRYPGHIEKMKMMRDTGFFSKDFINLGKIKVRPIDVTSRLLFPMWQLKDGERDVTVMRIEVDGIKGRKKAGYIYDLIDRYDPSTSTTSMARTTGYTCTSVVRLLSKGLYRQKGISPPEFIGKNEDCFNFVMKELAKRGIIFKKF